MAMIHGLDEVKITKALVYASGTSDRAGAALDMSGFQGCIVLMNLGAIAANAGVTAKIQVDTTDAFASAEDLAGSQQVPADDDDSQMFVWDVRNVPQRYIRVFVDKNGATAAAETVTYIQYGPDSRPITNTASNAVTVETHIWASTGTA
jgi:hypothetical protein